MLRLRILWLMVVCVLLCGLLPAQSGPLSVRVQAGVSYSGWNVAIVGGYHLRDFSGYAGPSMSLNRGMWGRGPVGLDAGINYHMASERDWLGSVVNLDYQLHFMGAASVPDTRVHELHLSYGLEFRVTESLFVIQQMGVGGYIESNPRPDGSRKAVTGYDGLVRLLAGYRF